MLNKKLMRFSIIIKIFLGALMLLLVSEFAVRLSCKQGLQRWSQCEYQADSVLGYRYKPNSSGVLSTAGFSNHYAINQYGFPGKSFQINKKPHTFRIIVVGASNENGLNTNGPFNYVSLLERYFKNDGFAVEVINMAVDGKNFGIRNVRLVKNECIKFNPDLILFRNEFPFSDGKKFRTTYKHYQINYYQNYKMDLGPAKKFIDNELIASGFRNFLFDHCYLYRYFVNYYIKNYQSNKALDFLGTPLVKSRNKAQGYARRQIFWGVNNEDKPYDPFIYTFDQTLAILKDLTTTLSVKKIQLIVYDFNELDSEIKKLYKSNNINFLQLSVPVNPNYSFGTLDGHATQEGHQAFAKALYFSLKKGLNLDNYQVRLTHSAAL